MFVLGLALYAGSSLLGGLAGSPLTMIAARAAQGIGGAALFPATVSLINTLFEEGPQRNRALALWSLAGSSGLALGSIVGGLLVGTLGFFVNVPITFLVGLGAFRAIPRDPTVSRRAGFDLPGALVATGGVTLLVLTLVKLPEWGWTSVPALVCVLSLLGMFIRIEAFSPHPIMPLRLLAQGHLARAMILTFLFMGTFMALPFFTTELFQRIYRFRPLETGFAFLVPCIAIAIGTQIGGRLASRVGVRPLLLLGLSIGALGAAMVAANITPDGRYTALVPGLIIFGLGQGTTWTPMWITAAAGIPADDQGIASGMASTTLWIGGATGLAILVVIAGAPSGTAIGANETLALVSYVRTAIFAIAAGIALSLPVALLTGRAAAGQATITPH